MSGVAAGAVRARPVVIAAGGTGGHVVPGLAVAEALGARGVPVVWIGTEAGLEFRLVPAAGIELRTIEAAGLRGKGALARLAAPVRLARAVHRSRALLRTLRPRAVLGMGGFVSGPVGLAARLARVPLVLHEQNAVAGLTNRVLARIATRALVAFPGALGPSAGAVAVGNPVRDDIVDLARRGDADGEPGAGGPLRVLVVGGSRGAEALNEALPAACAVLARAGVRLALRHQAGAGRGESVRARYARVPPGAPVTVEASDFIDDMGAAYARADLVVCRSGAMTVTELAAAGRPAILVPYPHAVDDHQGANARWLADAGAALLMRQPLDPEALAAEIRRLDADRDALRAMGRAARARFVPQAAERVADALLEASGSAPGVAPFADPAPGGARP